MDIKGITRNVIPLTGLKKPDEAKTKSKLDADNEKEGNGQAQGESHKRRTLNPEEIQDAIKFLENLTGVRENNLTVRMESHDGISVVYVEDRDGKIVRRIPESDLANLLENRQKKSGNLLNKAM